MVDQAAPTKLDQAIAATPSNGSTPNQGPSLPEKPKLAPGIELLGEMKESAFAQPPWLASRDGKFLQITELVHHIAEQADGTKTIEEIAAAVSTRETQVTPAEVGRITETTLIPTGIIEKADGTVAEPPENGPSALSVNLKMKMLSPTLINIFTGALSVLYWPPVMIAVLIAAAVTQYWVFFVHGLGGSVYETFYGSGTLLAVLLMIIASAAFHEFGHASALRYGGGKVGGMGAGIYIVYPAFYTDVTDNYRLPRWSRVRTDLGGFYFNLIFGLFLTAAYWVTGEEVLLIGVAIIDIEIIHQLLPFIRLDGYWALADITGIPDFFSQIGPFIRSHIPSWVPFPKGRELPKLKPWARLFFALYILVTVPLLIFLFFLMFRALPRIIATAASAFAEQAGRLPEAVNDLDVVTLLATTIQMVLLLLPSIGITYLFIRLSMRFLRAVWNWSQPTWPRRAAGALATLGAVALFAYLWVPQLGLPGPRPAGDGGSVLAFTPPRFEPIRPDERLTVFDAVRGQVVPRLDAAQPRQGGEDTPAAATPEATPPAGATTPQPATPASGGSGGSQGTPRPAATPTVAPARTATPIPTTSTP
jgi:putative peptide zinc metalloprotease protein